MDDRLIESLSRAGPGQLLLPRWRRDRPALRLLGLVAAARETPVADLIAGSRGPAGLAQTRQLAMYLTHVLLSRTLTEVGRLYGRDRTTVAHACNAVEDRRDDPALEAEIEAIESRLAAEPDVAEELRHAG